MVIIHNFRALLFRSITKKNIVLFLLGLAFLINVMFYNSLDWDGNLIKLDEYSEYEVNVLNHSEGQQEVRLYRPSAFTTHNKYLNEIRKWKTNSTEVLTLIGGVSSFVVKLYDIHANNYNPVPGEGEDGEPVRLSGKELLNAKRLFSLHMFNIVVSDRISINRSLPDMRSKSCKVIKYNLDKLATASVIIAFHNEAWSTLMRTVMSVLLRSPKTLLKEIILVDDASSQKFLRKPLDNTIAGLEKVRLLRGQNRTGVVGARLLGARSAAGDVLVFLDSHCEVTKGWLEPLLERAGSQDVYVSPHIDIISAETLAYLTATDETWGGFSWRLKFLWLKPSSEVLSGMLKDPSKPYPTPVMAGGLYAVKKSLFWRLGGYDEGMAIWGAENLELSWRAWQCGARVEITSCSRIGHIFRKKSPYTFPGGVNEVTNENIARAARVWADEWGSFYFKFNSFKTNKITCVANRLELRQKLNCKSFNWYLNNIWPQHFFPTDDRWFGEIQNYRGVCIGAEEQVGAATGFECTDGRDLVSLVVYTVDGQIMSDGGICLEHDDYDIVRVKWQPCIDSVDILSHKEQIWRKGGNNLMTSSGLCLSTSKINVGDKTLTTETCKTNKIEQIWYFNNKPWRKIDFDFNFNISI